jgi:hypothetical protein
MPKTEIEELANDLRRVAVVTCRLNDYYNSMGDENLDEKERHELMTFQLDDLHIRARDLQNRIDRHVSHLISVKSVDDEEEDAAAA